ncbi:hypothetical protein OHC33_007854 [Knufia fluminis]|uniref:Uncharacterized protein n=1 Tax=Knufia fluminis TaxID=191047 RepID=A0AAN8F4H2_9EURO|nr:hypothetical protein OHC33_007854 [Knufia fluminis]
MEINQPPPSSQNPDSDLSHQAPPAQPLATPTPTTPPSSEDIYRRISSYPFHSDSDYQLGLAAILGHPETPPTAADLASNQDLVLQAQCFYLARKFGISQIDVEAYKEWLAVSQRSRDAQPGIGEDGRGTNGVSSPTERPSAPTPSTAAAATTDPPIPLQSPPQQPSNPPRPSAPTPSTAANASTLPVQPHTQTASESTPTTTSSTTQAQDPTGPAPPYPTSFADIVDLITQNKPIPGIEEIPDTVLEPGSSKQDRAVRRRKPWERDHDEGGTTPGLVATANSIEEGKEEQKEHTQELGTEQHIQTGEGVMKILQPGAVPDSGLVARE